MEGVLQNYSSKHVKLLIVFILAEIGPCTNICHQATEKIKMDEVEKNASSLTEDVSTLVPAPLSNDNVNKHMPKPVRNFDREQKQIQVFQMLCVLQ